MKKNLTVYFLFILTKTFSQSNLAAQVDSNLLVGINLHYQIPSFWYFNKKIENGLFEEKIIHEGETFTIQGGFKNFRSDGMWVAKDIKGTYRLLALFRSDTIMFLHLNDSLGRPAHHFTYRNNKIVNQEWYNNGRLDQYDEHSDTGRVVVSFHENMKHRLTFFINEKEITYKKWVYDENGVFIKETYNVNE